MIVFVFMSFWQMNKHNLMFFCCHTIGRFVKQTFQATGSADTDFQTQKNKNIKHTKTNPNTNKTAH